MSTVRAVLLTHHSVVNVNPSCALSALCIPAWFFGVDALTMMHSRFLFLVACPRALLLLLGLGHVSLRLLFFATS